MDVASWTIASFLTFLSLSTTPTLYHVKDEAKSDVTSLRAWTKHLHVKDEAKSGIASLRTWTKHVFPYPSHGTYSSQMRGVCKFTLMPSSTPSSEDDVLSRPAKASRRRRNVPPQDHHSTLLERTQRSSSRFASSSLKSILHSFSTAFRVDFISLRLSVFFLALAPTGKHATRRRRTGPKHCPFAGPSPSPLDCEGSEIHFLQPRHRDEVLILVRDFHTIHCDRLCRRAPWPILPPCTS